MKASKFMMSLSAAVFGGVMYMRNGDAGLHGNLLCESLCGKTPPGGRGSQGPQGGPRLHGQGGAHCVPRRPDEADPLMADWKKNRQKFQMPHDRVERCMRYVKAVEKAKRKAEKAKRAAARPEPAQGTAEFEALLLERWQARQEAKKQEGGHAEI